METAIGKAFLEESRNRVLKARGRIDHCLHQLQDEDLWWAPGEGCNCIGVLLQHLMGNLRQWIVAGVGGERDVRDRPREFLVVEKRPKAEMQGRFGALLDEVIATLSRLGPQDLLETRTVQGTDTSKLGAVYAAITHLELHAGQITYSTRLRLGAAYKEWWRPSNKEGGA